MLRFVILLTVFVGFATHPIGECVDDSVKVKTLFGRRSNELNISGDEFRTQPTWTPATKGEPPCTLGVAKDAAVAWLDKARFSDKYKELHIVESSEYRIIRICLEPLYEDSWFYRIEFEETKKGKLGWAGGVASRVDILVDMNGKCWMP